MLCLCVTAVCGPGQQYDSSTAKCVPCPLGKWNTGNDTQRFEQCAPCPDGFVTVNEMTGATGIDKCTLSTQSFLFRVWTIWLHNYSALCGVCVCVCVCVCVWLCVFVCVCVCVCVCGGVFVWLCVCVCVRDCVFLCCVCMWLYVCIHVFAWCPYSSWQTPAMQGNVMALHSVPRRLAILS